MFTPGERLPLEELQHRHACCRALLAERIPTAGGILVGGSPNIYYLTGTSANGLVWLPLNGEPVLAVRKGLERAMLESPMRHVVPFRSYRELISIYEGVGSPLSPILGVDQAGMSWEQGRMLTERLSEHTFIAGDMVIAKTRAVKSEWELAKMRESCRLLHVGQRQLAEFIHPGMAESEIAHTIWDIFFAMGNAGPAPTGMPGSTLMLGHISAGENGNYPSAYDGPVGIKGKHPAAPVMGNAASIWQQNNILTVDCGFNFEGYLSDRTQIYFSGSESAIPDIARKAHDAAITIAENAVAELKPGAIPAEIYRNSLERAEKAGFAQGFMGLGDNKVRFLGHGIGLTVSEWPIFAQSFTEPLAAGMTVALEPKIGLPGIGMVGVENTYEITKNGARCLTGNDNDIICL